jgi:hypothetical protein
MSQSARGRIQCPLRRVKKASEIHICVYPCHKRAPYRGIQEILMLFIPGEAFLYERIWKKRIKGKFLLECIKMKGCSLLVFYLKVQELFHSKESDDALICRSTCRQLIILCWQHLTILFFTYGFMLGV